MHVHAQLPLQSFFFSNDTAPTEIYTLSLHDALPIFAPFGDRTKLEQERDGLCVSVFDQNLRRCERHEIAPLFFTNGKSGDRKSTRLNSSHSSISYAVFCLKKKKEKCDIRIFRYINCG